jgi:hypothetical protein
MLDEFSKSDGQDQQEEVQSSDAMSLGPTFDTALPAIDWSLLDMQIPDLGDAPLTGTKTRDAISDPGQGRKADQRRRSKASPQNLQGAGQTRRTSNTKKESRTSVPGSDTKPEDSSSGPDPEFLEALIMAIERRRNKLRGS